jgi:hypothetical protein
MPGAVKVACFLIADLRLPIADCALGGTSSEIGDWQSAIKTR